MKKRLLNKKRFLQFALSLCLILMSNYISWGQGVTKTTPGTYTYTVPAGVTNITIQAWGGGGAGGSATVGSTAVNVRGGGGAGGSYASTTISVTPGDVINYIVGAGATGLSTFSTGNVAAGAFSSANLNGGTDVLKALGGNGGLCSVATTVAVNSSGGAAFTSGNTGSTPFYGGSGANAASGGSGGGGSAGTASNGGNGSNIAAGTAGTTGGAAGGAPVNTSGTAAAGLVGGLPGGGGSGASIRGGTNTSVLGGSGGAGKVVISYPIISKTGSFSSLSTIAGVASGSTSISVTGTDMQSTVTVTASTGFEVSIDNSIFSSAITSTATSGTSTFTVYLRLAASASEGTYASGTVTFTGTNAATVTATIPSSTVSSASVAAVTVSTTSLSTPFAKMTAGTNSSTSQSFTVSGVNLGTNAITIAAPTHFKISLTDVDANYSSSSIVLTPSSGTVSTTTIYVKYSPTGTGNISGNSASISITNASVATQTVSVSGSGLNTFYYNSGSLATLGSWKALSIGSGDSPADFTTAGITYTILTNATTNASWTVSGSGSKVIVGNGSAVTLTVADTFPIIGTIDAAANGSVVWQNVLASPTFGTLNNDSEVHFAPAVAASYSFGATTAYGKLFVDGAGEVSVSNTASTPTVKTALTVASGSTLSFTSNNTPTISVNAAATATINGTIKTSKPAGLFASTGSIPLNATATLVLGATSTIEFSRSGALQTVTGLPGGVSYANLILSDGGSSSSAAKTIAAPFTVNGTLTINLATPAFSTISAASNITMANGATVVMTSGVLGAIPSFANGSKFNVTYSGNGKTQIIGTTTASSTSVTLTSSNTAIVAGMTVTGTAIPAGTTVASISGTALVLSAAATVSSSTPTLTFGTVVPQTTGVDLPSVANDALGNLTFDNIAGVVLSSAVKANNIITSKSNALTLNDVNFLNANLQVNGASELTLNVNANQANLKQIVFSGATTAKLKLNINAVVTAVAFTNSSAQNWGTGTLEITGFVEGEIKFGTSNTALTATQLGLIKDIADPSKTFKLSDQGYLYYSTTIVPGDAFVVTSDNPVYLAISVASTYSITATNSPTNFVLADATNSPLPSGLTLNATTGAIEGTPTVAVTNFVVPITLTNLVGTTNTINFTFNVRTRDPQTITWNQNFPTTNTYGDAAIALTATTSAPLAVSYSSSNTAVATISGSTLTIVGPGTATITASQAGNADYNPATNLTKQLVVNQKELTIASAAATGKVYNQSTTATITGTLVGGLVGADVVTLLLSATYADANAGVNKSVTSTSTLTGSDAAKYSLTQPTGLTATITKADQLLAALGTSSFKILGDADYDPIPLVTDPNVTGVASVAIENPNFTYTSSDSNVATIVNGKVHIVGLGSTTITGVQASSINYNESAEVSQTLKVLLAPLASWDLYNFNPTSIQQSVTSVNASEVAAGFSVTPSLSMGNMNIITNAGNRYRFTSSDWPFLASNSTSSPSIDIATGKYMSVVIAANSENSMSLSSINASFRGGAISSELLSQFAYSIDGTNFIAIGSPTTFAGASGTRFYSDIDLSGIAALQNLPSGTTVTLRYYASGKSNVTTSTASQKAWGFFSDFIQNNTRALIIGGTVTPTSTTWNGTAWSNGTPTASLNAIINGVFSTTATGDTAGFSAKTLTVNLGKTFTINTGHNITVTGAVTNNGTLTIENNANLIQGSATTVNANTGAITVKRNSANIQLYDYTLWSSPVAGQDLRTFSSSTLASRFYTYNSTSNLYNVVDFTNPNNFAPATGYLIRAPNTWSASDPAASFSGVFTGVPNNGNISVLGLISGKYYAVGNPYPSTINVAAFYNANPNAGTLYFWRKTNGAIGTAYATRNSTGSTAASGGLSPSSDIAVGQGFFVSPSANMDLNFTNTMRVTPSTSATFLRTTQERSRYWLNLTNASGAFSQMLVGYLPDATSGVDNAIDGKYINDAPIALTSILNAEEYTIQGRALPFAATDTVPLGFKTNTAGNYTIALDHVDGLFSAGQTVFLKDNLVNTVFDLSAGSYTFASAIGTFNSRFEVVYQSTLAVTNPTFTANSVIAFSANGEIRINSGSTIMELVRVYDLQGRLLVEKKQINASETKLSTTAINQVLLVEITAANGSKITKKIIQ